MTKRRTAEDLRYGARLMAARRHAGYEQATDAVKAMNHARKGQPKVTQSTYDNHEDGFRIPHWVVSKRYAAFYGVRPLWLAFEDGPMLEPRQAQNEALELLKSLEPPFDSIAMETLRTLSRQQTKE